MPTMGYMSKSGSSPSRGGLPRIQRNLWYLNLSFQISSNITNTTSADELIGGMPSEPISYWYFGLSVAVWFTSPLLPTMFGFILKDDDFSVKILDRIRPVCHQVIYFLFKVIFFYILSIVFVYIFVPIWDIALGLENLFCHANYKLKTDGKTSNFEEHSNLVPRAKLLEQIGEAVPQFIIAVVFYSKNFHWLSTWDRWQGGLTMTLSTGSILLGFYNGCNTCFKETDWINCSEWNV